MSADDHEPPAGDPPAPPGPPDPPDSGAPRPRRQRTAPGGSWFQWVRRFAKLWGFLGFFLLLLILFRGIILPFIFGVLLAYVLGPVVTKISARRDGSRRMPRGAAILLVYVVVVSAFALFLVALLPRLSQDAARIGREAPQLYKKLNDDWAPRAADWLETKFPVLKPPAEVEPPGPPVADVPLPPGTSLVVTPLPDGRLAIALQPSGVRVHRATDGSFLVQPNDEPDTATRTVDRIRALAAKVLVGLQTRMDDAFRIGRDLIAGAINLVFKFFLVLMIAGFIMLDMARFHAFARGMIPKEYAGDYQVVAAGIDRALSGVIRGQLLICLVNGVLTYIGLLIFGVKYSFLLATVATVLSLIPIFGTILSTIPIVLAALVSGSEGVDVTRGVFILLWIIGIHFIEANFLNPKIIGDQAKIHPVLVVFALLAGEHTYGFAGALLGVPFAAIVQVLFLYFRRKAWKTEAPAV